MADAALRRAVALAGEGGPDSTRLLAKAYGEQAELLIAEARRQGVYVHDAPQLVALLMQLDFDERIPQRLYGVIAELLVWAREVDERVGASEPAR